jgi:succinate dehydrogenase/fumarate reductase-like Fe-S protein
MMLNRAALQVVSVCLNDAPSQRYADQHLSLPPHENSSWRSTTECISGATSYSECPQKESVSAHPQSQQMKIAHHVFGLLEN